MAHYFIEGIAIKEESVDIIADFFLRLDEYEKVRRKKNFPRSLWYTEKDYDTSDFDMEYAERQESLCWHGNNILRNFEKYYNSGHRLSKGTITVLRVGDLSTTKAVIAYAKTPQTFNAIPQSIDCTEMP